MTLTCTFDPAIESWVISGQTPGVGGAASLVLSDVRLSVDALEATKIVEISVFSDDQKQVSKHSMGFLQLLLGEDFPGLQEGAQIELNQLTKPLYWAGLVAQTLALRELESPEFRLRGLDVVAYCQPLGQYATDLVESELWGLLPAVTGLGNVVTEEGFPGSFFHEIPAAARLALHSRVATYLDSLRAMNAPIDAKLLEYIEWLVALSEEAPDDVASISTMVVAADPISKSVTNTPVAARSAQHEPTQAPDRLTVSVGEIEDFIPRLGRHAAIFGRGPILLEHEAGLISSVSLPVQSGVQAEDLRDVEMRLVDSGTYTLVQKTPLTLQTDPRTGYLFAVAAFANCNVNYGDVYIDLCSKLLPTMDKTARNFVLRHKAATSARRALIAFRNGHRGQSDQLWQTCRHSSQYAGAPGSVVTEARHAVEASLDSSPDWLAPIVRWWTGRAASLIAQQEPTDQHLTNLENMLREVNLGLGQGPVLAGLYEACSVDLTEINSSSPERVAAAREYLDQAARLFDAAGESENSRRCVDHMLRLT